MNEESPATSAAAGGSGDLLRRKSDHGGTNDSVDTRGAFSGPAVDRN